MFLKRAITYQRISNDRQSNWSIEGQQTAIQNWCDRNQVEIVDAFVDDGYTATNFDRPDYKRLNNFIEKHYRTVDHLVVFAFDRFSRDAGEALVAIKKLQRKFAIKIVSVAEGIIFDADDPASFFYAGLMLLKGEDEIIRNKVRINMGIHTAKKLQGRFLGSAPFGYKNSRDEQDKPIIIINPETEPIVRYIFKEFLMNSPIAEIAKGAKKLGYNHRGNSSLQRILKNPVYIGLIHVRAYKDSPDEWVEGIHQPIVDKVSFYEVQNRFNKPRQHVQIADDLPLRGVLKCHCGLSLTGAPSRGKSGKYFFYYKCKKSGHNNISAIKAHEQLDAILDGLSIPEKTISAIKKTSKKYTEEKLRDNKQLLGAKTSEYNDVDRKLKSVEEKWINNQIAHETYSRWYTELNKQKQALKVQVDMLAAKEQDIFQRYENEFQRLKSLKEIYHSASTIKKQELIKVVFDSRLYYKNSTYRTPYLLNLFSTNLLNNSDLSGSFLYEKGENFSVLPFGGAEGVRTLVQLCDKLCLLHACFPFNCREQTGRKPTLSFSLGTLSRRCIVPYSSQLCYFDAPDSNLTMQQSEGQKLS